MWRSRLTHCSQLVYGKVECSVYRIVDKLDYGYYGWKWKGMTSYNLYRETRLKTIVTEIDIIQGRSNKCAPVATGQKDIADSIT